VNQGTVKGLRSLTIDDLKAFHRAYFTRDRIVVGVAGGYPEEFLSWLDRDFGALPEGEKDRKELKAIRLTHPLPNFAAPEGAEEQKELTAQEPSNIDVLICEKPCGRPLSRSGFLSRWTEGS